MKRALVTGGAGFLGSHLCRRLLADGFDVTALDNLYTGSMRNVEDLLSNASFRLIKGDVIDFSTDESFDDIYNLACPASPVHYQARPVFTMRTSVLGTMNMLELAKRCGAKLLHCSTSEIYGDPLIHPQQEKYWGNVNTIGIRSCYDEGKRCAETLCADYIREFDTDARMVLVVTGAHDLQRSAVEEEALFGVDGEGTEADPCRFTIEAFPVLHHLDGERIKLRMIHVPALGTGYVKLL